MQRTALCWWGAWVFMCLSPAVLGAEFFPRGHALEGLPDAGQPWRVYDDDPAHPLNRLHRMLFLENLVPAEVHQQLPALRRQLGQSDEQFFTTGWYFQKRAGTEQERQFFGGDVRVSPRQSFSDSERGELLELVAEVTQWRQQASLEVLQQPLMRLLLQWDLLSVWWQLERASSGDTQVLVALAHAIAALSQEAAVLERLPSGLSELLAQFPAASAGTPGEAYLPPELLAIESADNRSDWTEVGRRSTQLFHAQRTLRVSKAYLNTGARSSNLAALQLIAADPQAAIDIPEGTQTLLVMQLIGLDSELNPVATPVIDELRLRAVVGPAELTGDSPTSSRDGSSHWIYMRTRAGTRSSQLPDFRFVPDTAQALFVEYGTRKHATYAAQCALCHRRTHAGGQAPEGIRMLSQAAAPHVAQPQERTELAKAEMAAVVERLKSRLAQVAPPVPADAAPASEGAARRPARPERSPAERAAWIEHLRAAYQGPASQWPAPHVDVGVQWSELGTLPAVGHPADNPLNPDKQKLGQMLFFDPRLSGSQQLACASCHDPDLGWGDGKTFSFGHSRTMLSRNTPSIRNAGHWQELFWDGRAVSLEEQALQVLANPSEMRASEADVVARLSEQAEYRDMFAAAFGGPGVTLQRIAQALACYERTVVGGHSRFDAFVRGNSAALKDDALVGLDLFRREARCINCHHGPLFSDNQYHNVGLSYYGRKFEDLGRYEVTHAAADVGKFRTPSLRDVTRTTPLMHNGLFELPGVLNMYNAGMPTLRPKAHQVDDPKFPVKSPHLQPLQLNATDLQDLAAFLGSLEEPKRRIWPPPLPGMYEPRE